MNILRTRKIPLKKAKDAGELAMGAEDTTLGSNHFKTMELRVRQRLTIYILVTRK